MKTQEYVKQLIDSSGVSVVQTVLLDKDTNALHIYYHLGGHCVIYTVNNVASIAIYIDKKGIQKHLVTGTIEQCVIAILQKIIEERINNNGQTV